MARSRLAAADRDLSDVSGWEPALADITERLRHAEDLDSDVTTNRRLSAALDVELSELESLRQFALLASGSPGTLPSDHTHIHRLADLARQPSRDDRVRLGAALLLARERLAAGAGGRREDEHPARHGR